MGTARAFAIVPDTGDETHDDFKPQYKQPPVQEDSVEAQIRKDVTNNSVFIYMKVWLVLFASVQTYACCLTGRITRQQRIC